MRSQGTGMVIIPIRIDALSQRLLALAGAANDGPFGRLTVPLPTPRRLLSVSSSPSNTSPRGSGCQVSAYREPCTHAKVRGRNCCTYRKRLAAGDTPDVFTCEKLPHALRVRIVHIWRRAIGQRPDRGWAWIHDRVAEERGQSDLADGHGEEARCANFVLNRASADEAPLPVPVHRSDIESTDAGTGCGTRLGRVGRVGSWRPLPDRDRGADHVAAWERTGPRASSATATLPDRWSAPPGPTP